MSKEAERVRRKSERLGMPYDREQAPAEDRIAKFLYNWKAPRAISAQRAGPVRKILKAVHTRILNQTCKRRR
jgi:hypothetical protein